MNHAIILAAGQGQRMLSKKDKMLILAAGKPLIYYSLIAFNDNPEIDTLTIVVNKNNKAEIEEIVKKYRINKAKKVVIGGLMRQNSLSKALDIIKAKKGDLVVVHNGANPLPSFEEVYNALEIARETGACIVGHFVSSTIKEIDDKHVIKTHDRSKLFAAETAQIVEYSILKKAYQNAKKSDKEFTDEAMMLEEIGQKVSYIEASEDNFKITTQADYARLRMILGELPEDTRIGIGQDSHMFEEKGKGLVLAGVKVPDFPKLKADSDGDVILHALFNALSQAIGDMSLGFYSDEMYKKGVTDSQKYLEIVLKKVKKEKFNINSLGLMIECGKPKIDPLVAKMKKSLAQILDLKPSRIGITATSGENLTVFGKGLGIQCFAIVSLQKEKVTKQK